MKKKNHIIYMSIIVLVIAFNFTSCNKPLPEVTGTWSFLDNDFEITVNKRSPNYTSELETKLFEAVNLMKSVSILNNPKTVIRVFTIVFPRC